ncbi:MAG TPA: hypothetical protein VJ654_09205 [Noviherbaspirillum sp.]|nr:hypothetical protein [Noviherbaspirillum sp.]
MSKETYLSLQHSESVVAAMAATIYAAYVQRHEITDANEDVFIRKAVNVAAKLAACADKQVKSDEEWMSSEHKASPIL